jgi:uncharacterized protein
MAIAFDYDSQKSAANKLKHGIDFNEAQALWLDADLVQAPARTDDEPRFLAVGKIAGKHWSAIWTLRGEAIRLISVRRARKQEIDYYESA